MLSTTTPMPRARPLARADDGSFLAGALAGTCAPPDSAPTVWQRVVVEAACTATTGRTPAVPERPRTTPAQVEARFRHRPAAVRAGLVRLMTACTLTLRPVPGSVVDRVQAVARALHVDEQRVETALDMSGAALGLVAVDFDRHGYARTWRPEDRDRFRAMPALAASWELGVRDEALAARWRAFAQLPPGTLGRALHDFYATRGLALPGTPGSAPLLLSQHDWVHVLADYGTSPSAELEVWALTAATGDDLRSHVLLAMATVLTEWGCRSTDAAPAEMVPWHPCSASSLRERLADAMGRGARCREASPGLDLLGVDWTPWAVRPLAEVRQAVGLPPKSDRARRAGSPGAVDPSGASTFVSPAGPGVYR